MQLIKAMKLVTGEELIGDINERMGEDVVEITDPAAIHYVPGQQNGQMSIGLIPFAPYSDSNKFKFSLQHIVTMFEPNIEMRNNYSRLFGSGIEIARGTII